MEVDGVRTEDAEDRMRWRMMIRWGDPEEGTAEKS